MAEYVGESFFVGDVVLAEVASVLTSRCRRGRDEPGRVEHAAWPCG
jgi:PleD family two-component response regulator